MSLYCPLSRKWRAARRPSEYLLLLVRIPREVDVGLHWWVLISNSYLQFDIQWSSLGAFVYLFREFRQSQLIGIPTALLYYDYALTLPDEIMYIWMDKFRLSTGLYILCRYAMVANVLYILARGGRLTSEVRPRCISSSFCE